ncbi:Hypothetical protein FKW44_003185 [Caligus rogercresseyi]|uniref:Uncharacterized protein n=1 Tax=Caligus rogercresseyi TaxID=217165 RepID=A0A7T8QWX7_CALRO|nr:Hypothetical protein FKW44_003185 [Caligus rogercresseyi]
MSVNHYMEILDTWQDAETCCHTRACIRPPLDLGQYHLLHNILENLSIGLYILMDFP